MGTKISRRNYGQGDRHERCNNRKPGGAQAQGDRDPGRANRSVLPSLDDEICQILSGRGTITEPDGTSFEIGPGTLFVTPAGWEGHWTIHETVRKMWVVADVPATTE
jgi:uncharacterized cupin superfamily protein